MLEDKAINPGNDVFIQPIIAFKIGQQLPKFGKIDVFCRSSDLRTPLIIRYTYLNELTVYERPIHNFKGENNNQMVLLYRHIKIYVLIIIEETFH